MLSENSVKLHSKDFQSNTCISWKNFRNLIEFNDVTIACEDDQIEAHKVVLSACSSVLGELLKKNPHKHPLIFLRGVKYLDLVSVIEFMYQGQVNVLKENLDSFLVLMKDLNVKGDFKTDDFIVKMEETEMDNRIGQNEIDISTSRKVLQEKKILLIDDMKTFSSDLDISIKTELNVGLTQRDDSSITMEDMAKVDQIRQMEIDIKKSKDSKFDWKCDVCNISFNNRVKLREHRKEVKCKQGLVCTNKIVTGKNVIEDTKNELIKLNEDPKSIECYVEISTKDECDVDNIDESVNKLSDEITNYTKIGEIYSCNYCNMTLTKERTLQKHIKRVHLKEFFTVICEICDKPFYKDDIKTHVKVVHTKEIRYTCDLCDFGCFEKQRLNKHVSAKHENLKFYCKVCGFESSDKRSITRHETTVHSDERNFICDICLKQFKEKRKLKSHIQNCHGTENYLCGTCGKGFPSKDYLKTHEKHHDTDLLLSCSFCGKGFVTAHKLKEHINIHTGEKPFSCPLSGCDKSYPSSSALAHHKKSCSS